MGDQICLNSGTPARWCCMLVVLPMLVASTRPWFVTTWGQGVQTFCTCSVHHKPHHPSPACASRPAELNCRFVLCCGAAPSCSKALRLFVVIAKHDIELFRIAGLLRQICHETSAGFARRTLSSSHFVVLMVKIPYSSRTQCSQPSEEIWPQRVFKYTEELKGRKIKKKNKLLLIFNFSIRKVVLCSSTKQDAENRSSS